MLQGLGILTYPLPFLNINITEKTYRMIAGSLHLCNQIRRFILKNTKIS